jgi:predicted nucleic acid-binding protein
LRGRTRDRIRQELGDETQIAEALSFLGEPADLGPAALSVLVDTNILVRAVDPADPAHGAALNGLERLRRSGATLLVAAQNVAELWNVLTRGVASNGLGWPLAAALAERQRIERLYRLVVADDRDVYERWKRLVDEYRVTGHQVFDARLAAVMQVAGIGAIVTFNRTDFARYGVDVIDPRQP